MAAPSKPIAVRDMIEQLEGVRAAVAFTSIACGGDRARMVSTLVGALVVVAQSMPEADQVDDVLAIAMESIATARRSIATKRAAG